MSISRFIQHSLKRFREIRNSTKPLPNPDWYVPPPDRSLTKLKLLYFKDRKKFWHKLKVAWDLYKLSWTDPDTFFKIYTPLEKAYFKEIRDRETPPWEREEEKSEDLGFSLKSLEKGVDELRKEIEEAEERMEREGKKDDDVDGVSAVVKGRVELLGASIQEFVKGYKEGRVLEEKNAETGQGTLDVFMDSLSKMQQEYEDINEHLKKEREEDNGESVAGGEKKEGDKKIQKNENK